MFLDLKGQTISSIMSSISLNNHLKIRHLYIKICILNAMKITFIHSVNNFIHRCTQGDGGGGYTQKIGA